MSTALKKKDRTHLTTTSPVLHPCGGITNVEIARRLVVIRYNCIHFSVLESSFYPSESLTKDVLRARNIKFADASTRKGYFYNQRIKTNGSHNLKRKFLLWICHQLSLVSGAVTSGKEFILICLRANKHLKPSRWRKCIKLGVEQDQMCWFQGTFATNKHHSSNTKKMLKLNLHK